MKALDVIFHEGQETHLGTSLDATTDRGDQPQINTFFQAFLNLLQTDAILNKIIHGQMEGERPRLAPSFQTLMMFIVKSFERDSLQGFWSLGDMPATHAIPFLETLAAS